LGLLPNFGLVLHLGKFFWCLIDREIEENLSETTRKKSTLRVCSLAGQVQKPVSLLNAAINDPPVKTGWLDAINDVVILNAPGVVGPGFPGF
jgi:hypothetical protein